MEGEALVASRGWDGVTATDIARMQRKDAPAVKPSRHKYKAEACLVTADLSLFTEKDVRALTRLHVGADVKMPLRRLAMTVSLTGLEFPSTREGKRYIELKRLEQAGVIARLELQVPFLLCVDQSQNAATALGEYRLDFRYQRDGRTIHEDAKGVRTALYAWKKKHVEAQYGINISEV